MADDVLREAAEFFYDVNGLWEDEDLDPDDHVAVLVRSFTSADCDDLAYVVNLMTGWQVVRVTWQMPDWGWGHHTMVRDPGGRLLDASGWVDEATLRRRYLRRKPKTELIFSDVEPTCGSIDDDVGLQRVAAVVRALPYAPFTDADFASMSRDAVTDPRLPPAPPVGPGAFV